MEVTRRRKKLLDDLKDRRGYSHLKKEALERPMWRNRFGGGFEPVVRQNTERMNIPSEQTCEKIIYHTQQRFMVALRAVTAHVSPQTTWLSF
jgi:hypothetical protein